MRRNRTGYIYCFEGRQVNISNECADFELYNVTDFKTDFPWVKPIGICSKDRSITNYVVLSEDGGFATVNYKSDIAIYEGEFFEGTS